MPRKDAKEANKAGGKASPKKDMKGNTVVRKEKIPVARLLVNRAVIDKEYGELADKAFGKIVENGLEISFVETLYLLHKGRIELKKDGQKITARKLMPAAIRLDRRIHEKYVVYEDLRERGLVVKTGFKFGCDFRVYKRGVQMRKGPKSPGEHTKWIVYVVPEDYTCAFQELSRAVRLAHSIRARMLWAIVDNENNVTYYEVLRLKP
ncbi:MAG: tRNA-intron lyase [Candidatus Aenigmarchaeota archaeon]|nr:tRNA-intron lyase [Candidatus Aenigmarchaeota archaeon]